MILAAFRAELLKARKRPATWVLMGLLIFYLVFSQYLMQYGYYLNEEHTQTVFTVPLDVQILALLPLQSIQNVLQVVAFEGTAIGLIFGALIAGSEYGWGTWKTALAQRPPRLSVFAGQVLTVALILWLTVPLMLLGAIASGTAIGLIEHKSLAVPPLLDLAETWGASFLILFMPACMGLMLAVLMRGTALAIGAGLGWLLVVEAAVEQFASTIPLFQTMQQWFPGANAISLSTLFGSVGGGVSSATTGPALGSPPQFAYTLLAYIVAFLLCGALLFRSRDLA